MPLPRWFQPWHVLALGGSILGLGIARRALGSLQSPSGSPPSPSNGWQSAPEGFSALEPEKTCSPTAKPGVVAFMRYVIGQFGGSDLGIIRECEAGLSGHTAGTAWDWGVLQYSPRIDEMFAWLFANDAEIIRRAGIMYVIYNRQIWNTRDRVWQNYTGTSPHTDHVHFSFGTAGAMGRTSFYTENVA